MESRGSPDQEDEEIVQVREALMFPGDEKYATLRTARFLNYTTKSIDDDAFELPRDAFAFESAKLTGKITFPGWGSPSLNWIEWVNVMTESHAQVWKQSGVYEAILGSRYQIKKQNDLVMALVKKWSFETNTFVFYWGEATLTLEDMIVLGGLSVTGNNALAPIKREVMKEVEEKMKEAKREIEAKLEKKCCISEWMKEMMNSGNEIEHEAFMVSWLSRFVFPNSADLLREKLFPAAVQLVKGVRLALAPAVLARIYRDLGYMKQYLVGISEKESVVVKSPFHFVQVWALERFMGLQPPGQPSQLKPGEPRIARWHYHGGGQDVYGYPENIGTVLNSAKDKSFDYRPYTKPLDNFKFPKFYLEDDCWIRVRSDETIVAFGRCLRFAKLVGLDCIEGYYPHRVALQFGYDQDVPGVVPARTYTPELAWKDYIRPLADGMLYFPARVHEADVTVGYIRWWEDSVEFLLAEAKKLSHKLLASTPKLKSVSTSTSSSSSTGKWKTSGAKAEGKDQELVQKKEIETKSETSVTGSMIEVNRADGRSHGSSSSYAGSLTGSEEATKHPLKKPEWVQGPTPRQTKSLDRSSDKPEWVQRPSPSSTKSPDGSFDKPKWVQRSSPSSTKSPDRSSDKPKWVQRSTPGSTRSPDRSLGTAADEVKDLKGALRGSGGAKGQGHVTFQLPSSPGRSPSRALPVSPKQNDSPIKKQRMLPRVASIAKQSSSSSRVPRHTSSVSLPPQRENYIKNHSSSSSRASKDSNTSGSSSSTRKNSPKSSEPANSGVKKNSPSQRASKEPYKSPSNSGSSSLTRKKSPRSPEAVSSRGNNNNPSLRVSKELNKSPSVSGSPSSTKKKSPRSSETVSSSSGGNSAVKKNTEKSITDTKQDSPSKTQPDLSKANANLKLLEEMVILREQVGEDGEVIYQIPKQQFDDLSKGVLDVLHDLQSIKSALNIQNNVDK